MNGYFIDMLLLLGVAVMLVWAFRALKLPAILAYLTAGVIAGPDVSGWIAEPHDYEFIAELGVVLLLFSLGLEFSLAKMIAMRKLVFGLGAGQVVVSTVLFTLLSYILLDSWTAAFIIGALIALSSTAVVIKQLGETAQLTSRKGQMTVAVLLFQDIAVVPMLIIIPLLASNAGGSDQSIWLTLGEALFKGLIVVVALMAAGKWLLPHIFREIARQRTDELFVLATLLVALVAGGITHMFGLSMALGAFLAGMMLGESKYKHQLEADIRPFRDILMGLFFITVGMQLNLSVFITHLHWIILAVLGIGTLKLTIVYGLARLMGERKGDSLAAGMMLFQLGEFGFVLIALASSYQLVGSEIAALVVGIGVFGMALTPLVIQRANAWCSRFLRDDKLSKEREAAQLPQQPDHHSQVLIFGYGRVGQTISRFLAQEQIDHLAIDHDARRVQEAIIGGANVFYGSAERVDILKAVHAEQAELMIISFADDERAIAIVKQLRELNDHAEIIVRSRDDKHLDELMSAGASQVVPDTLEASLMLVSQVLSRSGVPIRKILARLDQARRSHYGDMHGFYPGETTLLTAETASTLMFLHAVPLACDAYAIDKTLADLKLDDLGVSVRAVRRGDQETTSVAGDFCLQCDDVLVLAGRPHAIEAAEAYILKG